MLMVPDTIGEIACKRLSYAHRTQTHKHTQSSTAYFLLVHVVITVPNFVCYLADERWRRQLFEIIISNPFSRLHIVKKRLYSCYFTYTYAPYIHSHLKFVSYF